MEKVVKLQIDGKEVKAPAGMNLIDAAELVGIHIPHLCYHKGLKGVGACRLCLVEIEGMKSPVIGCNTKVREGMVVHTKTDKVQEIRKFVIDLILSIHPLDCMTCTKAGMCNLQQYAYEFELKETSFTRKKMGYPVDETNPFIRREPEYCILCGRCVRLCEEQGTKVLEFMGRGIESMVGTAYNKPLLESGCTFCGSCIDACPVNALPEADRWRKGREWEYEKVKSVCLLCGNGCGIIVSSKDGRIQKINTGEEIGSAKKYICAYGRFGYDYIESETRLKTPLKRTDGELKETTWKDALSIVADKLKKAGRGAGFISVAGIMNEDALTLKKLAKNVVKTKNFDTTISLYADGDSLKNSQTAIISTSDLIVLVGLNPSQWERILPALDASIRKRVNRGAKLIVINSSDIKIEEVAIINLKGNEISNLKGIAKALIGKGLKADRKLESSLKDVAITEEIEKAAKLIIEASEPLIFSSPSLFEASANIALIKGKVIAVGFESNARGIALMGLTTDGKTYKEMLNDGLKVLYAVGEVPLNKRPNTDFLIVQNSHLTELAQQADIVLPSATFFEYAGTIVDYLGRLKHLHRAIEPVGESKSHGDIFIAISKIMGATIKKSTEEEVKKASQVKTKLASKPFVRKEGLDISPNELIESINRSVIHGSRLLWLKEAVGATAA
ncbi:MAG: 2Fe-2S iron-sulfur cluster binding domain-containing protein [Nitrospira sp.]|nr:2Fe-2S iron-sulfur cluster binding domain-containing protein [Nitrospira sp.]